MTLKKPPGAVKFGTPVTPSRMLTVPVGVTSTISDSAGVHEPLELAPLRKRALLTAARAALSLVLLLAPSAAGTVGTAAHARTLSRHVFISAG